LGHDTGHNIMSVERVHTNAFDAIEGRLFEVKSSRSRRVLLCVNDFDQIELRDRDTAQREVIEILEFPNRVAGVPDTMLVRFAHDESDLGRRLELLEPLPVAFRFPGEHQGRNWLSVIEQNPVKFAIPFVISIVLAFFLYRSVLNVVVNLVVDRIPPSVETAISNQALDRLRIEGTFASPTKAYVKQQLVMSAALKEYAAQLGMPTPSLTVYQSTLGPNAFAFPAGPIVVTEELLLLDPSDDALRGLMAHEIAHIYERHGIRQAVRVLGLLTLITFAFDGDALIIDDVQLLYYPFITRAFSRADERAADAVARQLLTDAGHNRDGLIDMLRLLEASCDGQCQDFGLLSTHPSFTDRLKSHQHD